MREGAGSAPSSAGVEADTDEQITGETEHLHEAHGGGFSHFRHARHTEEVWKRNETELADLVNRLVEQNDVRLVIVTGDPHVVDLVSSALSPRARAVLRGFASDTAAAGASPDGLDAFLAEQLQRLARERQTESIFRAAAQQGESDSAADRRLQPVVHALQQARVETLLLDLETLQPHTLLSLAGQPWVAAVAAETFGAEVLETGSAAEALARAAIATSAEVIIVEHGTLPGGEGAAVITR